MACGSRASRRWAARRAPFNRLEIQFSAPLLSDTFTLADVALSGPGGVITPTALNYLADDRYELLSDGTGLNTYAIVIGPDIRDVSNRPMDQNHNGTPGEPDDAYAGALFSAGVTITDTQTTYEGQNLILYGNEDGSGSGVAYYDVYVSTDGGAFTPWQVSISNTWAFFDGLVNHTYSFYSVATDRVGNRQTLPTAAQATTTTRAFIYLPLVVRK